MKFLITIILSFPLMLFGQNEDKVNKIKYYLSTGVNIGNKDKIGYQVGLSIEKNNHTIQSQFMRSKEWVLSFYGNYQEPDKVENLCTYSIKYGYVIKSKFISLTPLIGVSIGKEDYRGSIASKSNGGGWFSSPNYTYNNYENTFIGGTISARLNFTNDKIGISFEPYLNLYNLKRPDYGLSINLLFGRIN